MHRRGVLRWTMTVCLCFCAAMGAAQSTSQVIQGEEVENFLAQAKITRQQSISVGVTLPRKLSLELDGKMQFGAFKTIDEGPVPTKQLDNGVEFQFQDSWRTEIAAYELDKLIGLGMVPATVERVVDGKRGSLQFFVTAKMREEDRVKKKLSAPNNIAWTQQIARIR